MGAVSIKTKPKKIRGTLDLTPQFYERLEKLEGLVEAGSKANLIRQALQLYEYVAKRTLEGYSFQSTKGDKTEGLVFLGPPSP